MASVDENNLNDVSSQVTDAIKLVSQILSDSASNKELSEFLTGDFSHVYSEQQLKFYAILSENLTIDDVRKYLEETSNVDAFKKNALLAILDNDTKKYYTSLLGYTYQQYASSKTPEEMIKCMRTLSDLMNLCKENGVSEDLIMKISKNPNEAVNAFDDISNLQCKTNDSIGEKDVITSGILNQNQARDGLLKENSISDSLLFPKEASNIILGETEKTIRQFALDILGYKKINSWNWQDVDAVRCFIYDGLDMILGSDEYKKVCAIDSIYSIDLLPSFLSSIKMKMKEKGLLKVDWRTGSDIIQDATDDAFDYLEHVLKRNRFGKKHKLYAGKTQVDSVKTQEAINFVLGKVQNASVGETQIDSVKTQEAIDSVLGKVQNASVGETQVDSLKTQEAIDFVLGKVQNASVGETQIDSVKTQEAIDSVLGLTLKNNVVSNQEILGNYFENSFPFRKHISKKVRKKVSSQEHDSIKYKIVNKIISVFGLDNEFQKKR